MRHTHEANVLCREIASSARTQTQAILVRNKYQPRQGSEMGERCEREREQISAAEETPTANVVCLLGSATPLHSDNDIGVRTRNGGNSCVTPVVVAI